MTWPASDLEEVAANGEVGPATALVLDEELATEAARAAPSRSAEPEPALAPDPPAPIARPGGSRPGRSWRRRGEQWGLFMLSPIVRSSHGVVSGWGAMWLAQRRRR